ncbi:SMI1/KNR4 family protein [Myxococcus sp. CA040A]|uniref:SMI1/KNR4 family protein n=1 Tax=Myxococcus sp. CA040A TaxID=2741738 RepID=UPI00157A5F8B|nr:SMI1/KNR4 family protein [Myxococcus sp. CA040A]NTX03417.1 SMI1/KNR4 family protein [Myxococcus sp. CA040A]
MLRLDEMRSLLDQIVDTLTRRNAFYENLPRPIPGPPAPAHELRALEKHWGFKLPSGYEQALTLHDGIRNFYFDVPLLSAREVLKDAMNMGTFKEPFPELWRSIFACGTDSYDAFAFDPRHVSAEGELEVVRLADTGEEERWPDFESFLKGYLAKLQQQLEKEQKDRALLAGD